MDKEHEHRPMTLEKKDQGVLGIHHVTAIARDPQKNFDFYAGVLGLRLVKLTVNFDDIITYHLYYGDELGQPGTILTFFPMEKHTSGMEGKRESGHYIIFNSSKCYRLLE